MRILASIVLHVWSDADSMIRICHVILNSSSQWIFGWNVTKNADTLHRNCDCIKITRLEGSREFITLKDTNVHLYISFLPSVHACSSFATTHFLRSHSVMFMLAAPAQECSWNVVRQMVDKVNRNVCGHFPHADMKVLLIRNQFWSDEVERYLIYFVEKCLGCWHMPLPQNMGKV